MKSRLKNSLRCFDCFWVSTGVTCGSFSQQYSHNHHNCCKYGSHKNLNRRQYKYFELYFFISDILLRVNMLNQEWIIWGTEITKHCNHMKLSYWDIWALFYQPPPTPVSNKIRLQGREKFPSRPIWAHVTWEHLSTPFSVPIMTIIKNPAIKLPLLKE